MGNLGNIAVHGSVKRRGFEKRFLTWTNISRYCNSYFIGVGKACLC